MQRDNDSYSDDLDRAIRDALHVDADRERLARLEQFWLRQSQRDRRRRVMRAWPLAAAGLAAVAAFVMGLNRERVPLPADAAGKVATHRVDSESVQSPMAEASEVTADSPSEGRLPTAYERVMFAVRSGAGSPAIPWTASVDDAIRQLAQHPETNVAEIVEASRLHHGDSESLLLRSLPNASEAERVAIVQLLAAVGTRRSVPALLQLKSEGTIRDDVAATIERIVGIEGLAEVVRMASDPEWRTALMLRLLTADSEQALLGYLSLVSDDVTHAEALAVAEEVEPLPIDKLVAVLDHENKRVRLAAAKVLGHVDGPEVAELLIARVTDKPADSQEAWLALLSCRGELAERFFAFAAYRPQLLGHYNGARLRWSQIFASGSEN